MGINRQRKRNSVPFWRHWFRGKRDEHSEGRSQPTISPPGGQSAIPSTEDPNQAKSPVPPVTSPEGIQPTVSYMETLNKVTEPRCFSLEKPTTRIGRALDNDLVINEAFVGWETVSRDHAEVHLQEGRWVLVDSGSLNGVFVNGRRTGRNFLRDGYKVSLGSVEFMFRNGEKLGS